MKPLGLYIHIPFCTRKCLYCDFVSYPDSESVFSRYIDAVIAEAGLYAGEFNGHIVDTVFFGGGTPSLLPPALFTRLVDGLKAAFSIRTAEITVEANPETLDEEKLVAYAQAGVNRLSIGLQTHDDALLARIGRRHTCAQFENALDAAQRYFDNINVDTIFALPGQTLEGFRKTIRLIIGWGVPHVSAYSLKLEAGTPLAASFSGADDSADRAMCHAAAAMLKRAGYVHYETSNFAKQGRACRHNLKYWRGDEYLGLGASAHSYLCGDEKVRFSNTPELMPYIKRAEAGEKPVVQTQILSTTDEKTEYILLRLRLADGIAYESYAARFLEDFKKTYGEAICAAKKASLIEETNVGIRPTLKGFDLQNTLIAEFIKNM